jgi:processive rubber oxygenase RoxA-like protein
MNALKRVVILALVGGIFALVLPPAAPAPDQPTEAKVVFLDQGWSKEDRLRYYYTSQGSALLPYDIFLNLEAANSRELFRAAKNMAGYGLIPEPADPKYNPDGLSVGLTRTTQKDGRWKGQWLGLTCAACHNAQLEYKGTRIRIEGGANNAFDSHAFYQGLDDALTATVADPKKFDRLAERLGRRDRAGKEALRKRLNAEAAEIHHYRGRSALTPIVVGPGRMDALSLIHNQVAGNALGIPENWAPPLAPVKSPFLWNTPQSSWVQWSGTQLDPFYRNAIESLGVFVKVDLTAKTPAEGLFESTMDLKGQFLIEDLLRKLAPPHWPEEILGKIDRAKAAKGAKLFVENCSECHSTWPHRWSEPKKQGKRFIENALVSIGVVGTDATQLDCPQFNAKPVVIAGRLSEYLDPPFKGAALAPGAVVFAALQRGVYARALAQLKLSKEELDDAHGYRAYYPEATEPLPALGAYKAGTREGIWAVLPFLHNGSVPNLYELLIPARERSKKFFLGREFDPVKVGVDTSGRSGKFLFDTSLIGNSNAGHSFENGPLGKGVIGRLLTEAERWALIEYLKSIPDRPGQVTPFGGPKNPIRAWADKTFFHVKHKGTYNE